MDSATERMGRIAADPARAGVFLDFDGTLAAIVDDPDDAEAAPGATGALAALARRYRVVAVVSGRPASDVAGRVEARGVLLCGLHGLERIRDGRVERSEDALAWAGAIDAAAHEIEQAIAGEPGAMLERKGLMLAAHWRRAPDRDAAESRVVRIVEEVAARAGLRVVPGRRVVEVRPPGGGDKGDALRRIAAETGIEAAFVAGDDVGDVSAFEAAARLPLFVRAAVASDEAPAELVDRADVVVASPAELLRLLERLLPG